MHGTIIARHAGVLTAFRLTLPAYFDLDRNLPGGVSGLIGRLRARSFTLADLRTAYSAIAQDSPLGAAERLRLCDVENIALVVGATVAAGLLPPVGEEPESGGDGEPITMGDIYATGFAIGLKPREIDEMTPWEFSRCVKGWNIAHGGEEKPAAPKQDEMAELFAKYG